MEEGSLRLGLELTQVAESKRCSALLETIFASCTESYTACAPLTSQS